MVITNSSSHNQDSKIQLVQNSIQSSMDPEPIDFDECFKDSPKFRQSLKENLNYVENLENCMSRAIKQINNYIDTGREHIKSQKEFVQAMKILNSSLGKSSHNTSKRVNTLLGALEEIMRLHEIVIDQSARTVGTSLTKFMNDDMLKIREARKSFTKISHEYDQALTKHSQSIKKQQEDSENLLIATSTAFTHTSLDLSIQLTALQSKKGFELLSSLLSFTKAHSTFFHQGSDLFEDLRPHISDMDEFLGEIQDEVETLVRNLPSKHLLVSNNELRPLCFDNKAQQVHLEGYLFKRASNGFKVWNRRWFILKEHKLLYQKREDSQPTVMEDDLRLLTVKAVDRIDNDRRFCFEVLSPQKSHILQADSESSCRTWISAIQAGINAAFHDTELKSVPKSTSTTELATGSNSWSSTFKALQHQATSRLNSITTSSDVKETSRNQAKKRQSKDNLTSCDENDDESCLTTKVDDQGRSYEPLKDEDDDDDEQDGGSEQLSDSDQAQIKYPNPAEAKFSGGLEPPVKPQRAYMIILAMPGNDTCADCNAPQPKWASINLGITLCIECAGIHRSLGVHLSKVRSLTLDTEVWSPEIVRLMLSLGNTSVNSAYLACYRDQIPPIDADSCREDRENWIKSKYLLRSFMKPPGSMVDGESKASNDSNPECRTISDSKGSDDRTEDKLERSET